MTSSIVLKNTASVRAKRKPTHAENSVGRALCDRPRVRKLSRVRSRVTCTDCLHLLWLWAVLVLSACSRSAPPPTPAPLPFCGDLCSHPTCLKERCYCFDNWKPTTGTLAWQVGSGRECEVPR